MHLSDIDYDLPQNLIAQHPIEPRDAARLLVDIDLNDPASEPVHRHVSDFVEFVRPGDVVVVNHTRVMPARVILHRASGGIVEALLLEEKDATTTVWESLLRPGGKLKVGEILYSSDDTEFLQVGERTEAGDTFLVRLLGGNVVDQLHDKDSLADSGTAEKTDLTSLGVRGQQIDDLDTKNRNKIVTMNNLYELTFTVS